jgi:hydrogenase maturation protease
MTTPAKATIIGIGNPLLTDDAVGIATVRRLQETLGGRYDIVLQELYTGGIRLMEAMADFERAWVVDAMVTGTAPPGTLRRFSPADFVATRHAASSHDTDLATALETARLLGICIPREITILGVEAAEVERFGEALTPAVAMAIPQVIAAILGELSSVGRSSWV